MDLTAASETTARAPAGGTHGEAIARGALLSQVRRTAEARLKAGLFRAAEAVKAELDRLGAEVSEMVGGCVVLTAPIKGMERAEFKVAHDYGGHWLDLKDAARITLVAASEAQMQAILKAIRRKCTPANGYSMVKDVATLPHIEPCGYSGHNFVVRFGHRVPSTARKPATPFKALTLSDEDIHAALAARSAPPELHVGRMGEIQVNTVAMMFGKMSQKQFIEKPGLGARVYHECRTQFGVDGGAAHTLYEIWRKAPASGAGRAAAELSKRYYRRLRRQDAKPWDGTLKQEVAAYCKKGGH
jgi:hypothetical protein